MTFVPGLRRVVLYVGGMSAYSPDNLELDLRWWAAANYLTVGQIYLRDNPLLREPLTLEHVKPRLLGHWGTSPGLSMLYAVINRVIRETDSDWLYVTGPGHGGPPWWQPAGWRGRTRRCTRTSPTTRPECSTCSGSSRRPAGCRAT